MSAASSRPCGSSGARARATPVRCTLVSREHGARADEFRAAFARLERTEPFDAGFRWHFRAEPGLEDRLRELARRERECCRFFEFRVENAGDAIVWEARADAGARPVLDQLMRLPETLRGETDVTALNWAMAAGGLAFASDGESSR